MNAMGVLLTLISISCTVAPVGSVLYQYQNNPADLIMTDQMSEFVDILNMVQHFVAPRLVHSEFNQTSHVSIFVINFTNPLNLTLTLSEASAELRCAQDQYSISNASIAEPIRIPAYESANITITCVSSEDITEYLNTVHANQATIDIELVRLRIVVDGFTVQLGQPIRIDNVPIIR